MRRLARIIVLVLAATLAGAGLAAPARADANRAVVIIDTGGSTRTVVVSFSGTISGYEALELAGAGPETYGFAGQGAAICRLLGVGNDPAGSSCLGTPDDPRYWAYYRAPDGATGWTYSGSGAGSTTVGDGDVEGWRFGTGGAPPFRSFCDVVGCAPAPLPDPPPTDGGVTVGGVAAAAPTPGGGPSGPAGPSGAVTPPGTERPDPEGADPAPADTAAPTVTAPPPEASVGSGSGSRRGAGARALGAVPRADDDGGSGSPVGVLAALVIVGVLVGAAVAFRRRGRAAG